MSDHKYFCIHDDIFDKIISTNQDSNILWRFISNEPNEDEYHSEATEIHNKKIQNKKRTANKYSNKHTLQIKRKKSIDFRKNSSDYFRVMIVDPPPKFNRDESDALSIFYRK